MFLSGVRLILLGTVWVSALAAVPATNEFGKLADGLERLRQRWRVPGMAAGVAKDGQVVWEQGFGFADLAGHRPATPDTVFHLASLTKPFAVVVLLQLVEAGQLDLEAPVAPMGVKLEAGGEIRVRHLLTHTSEGVPGREFRYSGNRFAQLDQVLNAVTQRPFAELVSARILEPLGLTNTSPNPWATNACVAARRDPQVFLRRSARGYAFDGATPVEYPRHFVTAAGLVSTTGDVLRFANALDGDALLRPETRRLMFSPARSPDGRALAYGLGWFVQQRRGVTVLWHYGWDRANSTLLIKVPERGVSFVLLGNSEALSRKFDLGRDNDVTRSPFAREFLKTIGL
ncbi:MAG: beta-lactamase family protein [Verrucomicrobiales bacterium]|nr:beta-lactamase family protein [Verrucomicrobiales bacterium]